MQGEAEYAFWHILTRDVAYAQLPRASRAARHVAAAAWIESQAPDRVEDLADVLAYHYATALELARAAGQADQAATLEEPARRFLALAGERALGLDTTAALTNLERALALTPVGPPRPRRGARALRRGRPPRRANQRGEAGAGGGHPGTSPAWRPADPSPRNAHAQQRAVPPWRSSLGGSAPRGTRPAGTDPTRPRSGRSTHRGCSRGDAPGQARRRDQLCRACAHTRRGTRPGTPRARPRLSRLVTR